MTAEQRIWREMHCQYPKLLKLARGILRAKRVWSYLPEDLVIDATLRLLPSFRFENSFKNAWYRSANHRVIDWMRSPARQYEGNWDAIDPFAASADAFSGVESVVIAMKQIKALRSFEADALAYDALGYTATEGAGKMSISRTAFKSRADRAKLKLREAVA